MPFSETERESNNFAAVPYSIKDYLELVDWYGRYVHPKKRGIIKPQQPKMLSQPGERPQTGFLYNPALRFIKRFPQGPV